MKWPACGPVRRLIIATLTCAALALGSAPTIAQDLEIIDLDFRLAEELLPILEPLVEQGGVLTGTDDVLFVRASPGNVAQIRAAVAALDRAPRQLLITVGQGTVRDVDAASAEGSATIGEGDVQIGVNRPPGTEAGVDVRVRARRQEADLHNVSSVRAIEGMETWIGAGQSVPLTETTVQQRPGGVVQQSTTYRDVSAGFYATARVSGDRVILDISARQQRYRPSSGAVATQGATTSVSGRLGEWLELGAVEGSGTFSAGGALTRGQRREASRYSVWVKVDET